MRKIELEEMKRLQIQILDYVDAFCHKHHITYSLSAGTLLGAVRHQGYIPWDDDIDIQLLRDDYERFITSWRSESHPYEFLHISTHPFLGVPFAKVSDPRTCVKEPGVKSVGVNIDVFPIDKVTNEQDFICRHAQVRRLYVDVWRKMREWSWRPNIIFWKVCAWFRTPQKDLLQLDQIAKAKNQEDAPLLFEMIGGRTFHTPWSKEAFSHTVEVTFEGRTYPAFVGYDEYLRAAYGDYMQLPPIEKRVTHHHVEAWWKD